MIGPVPAPDVVGLTGRGRLSNGEPWQYRVRCPACNGLDWLQSGHFAFTCHGCGEYRAHYTTEEPGWTLHRARPAPEAA